MKRIATMVFLAITFIVIPPAFAGWKSDIADNQYVAIEYIAGCMTGRCPAWPKLKDGGGWKGERALKECITYMKTANTLAKSGNANRITLPQFQYGPGQKGW